MNASASSLPRRPTPWLLAATLAVLLVPLLWFLRQKLHYYVDISAASYVVTFAFVTYRLVENILRSIFDQPNAAGMEDIATLMSWACWAVPLLLAEPLIQWRTARPR